MASGDGDASAINGSAANEATLPVEPRAGPPRVPRLSPRGMRNEQRVAPQGDGDGPRSSPRKSPRDSEDRRSVRSFDGGEGGANPASLSSARVSIGSVASIASEDGPAIRRLQSGLSLKSEEDNNFKTKKVWIQPDSFKVKKNHVACDLRTAKDFHLELVVTLRKEVKVERNICHLAISGHPDSHLPSISVVPPRQLVAKLVQESFEVTLVHPRMLQLGKPTSISLSFVGGLATFEVEAEEITAPGERIDIPVPSLMSVYLSSPWQSAADALVHDVLILQRQKKSNESIEDHQVSLQLPAAEKELIDASRKELADNKKWAKFDAVFGTFLMGNSLMIGLQTEIAFKIEADNTLFQTFWIIDSCFLVIFILELILRGVFTGKDWYKVLPRDGWVCFDTVIIIFGIMNLWVFQGQLPGFLRSLRLLRLIKLAKMVRLVRVFRELGMLLAGVLNSWKTLIYTFLFVSMMEYVAAIVLVRVYGMSGCTDEVDNEACDKDWEAVAPAMWRLTLLITFDDWVEHIRNPIFRHGSIWGVIMGVVLLFFIVIAGLGVLNMVVGVLCSIAFELDKKEKRRSGVEMLLQQKDALGEFRALLKVSGQRPLFKSDRFINSEELFAEVLEDPKILKQTKILALTRSDFVQLCEAFEENGEIEINGLIEAIGIRELQQYFDRFAMDLFSTGIVSSLRPSDALFYSFCISEVERQLFSIEDALSGSCSLSYEVLYCLYQRAQQGHTMLKINEPAWTPPHAEKPRHLGILSVFELKKIADQHKISKEEGELYMRMDIIFGFFIVTNGVFVGLQVVNENEGLEDTLYIIDLVFTAVFVLEFILRAMVFTQIEDIHTDLQDAQGSIYEIANEKSKRLSDLHDRMRFKLLAPCPESGCLHVLGGMYRMLFDASTFFDFVIIALSLLDSLVITQLRKAGSFPLNTDMISVLRIFRLFRLAKLLRIFRLLPQLQLLIFALTAVWKTIAWALVLMLICMYAFSIYTVILIGRSPSGLLDDTIQQHFSSIPRAMLSGWQLITLDDSDKIMTKVVHDHFIHAPLFFLFLIILGIGMMKIAVGVLCESAITLVRARQAEKAREDFLCFVRGMVDLEDLFTEHLGTPVVPQEILEGALDLQLRAKSKVLDDHGAATVVGDEPEVHMKLWKVGMGDEFAEKLRQTLKKAKLSPELVKRVFEKVDYARSGRITVDELCKGALGTKENLARIEMFALTTGVRDVRFLCSTLANRLETFHGQVQNTLNEMRLLVQRHGLPAPSAFEGQGEGVATQSKEAVEVGKLDKMSTEALLDLATYDGEKMLPDVMALGRMKVVSGTGKIQVYGDDIYGDGTEFRAEVKPGDIIVFEHEVSVASGKMMKTQGFVVLTVLSPTRLKVPRSATVSSTPWISYTIGKRVPFVKTKSVIADEVMEVERNSEGYMGFTVGVYGPAVVKDIKSDWKRLHHLRENDKIITVDNKMVADAEEFHRLSQGQKRFTIGVTRQETKNNLFKVTLEAPPADMSPRSAQKFFDWSYRTKQRDVARVKRHEERRAELTTQLKVLENDLVALHLRELAKDVFLDFRRLVKEEQRLRSAGRSGRKR